MKITKKMTGIEIKIHSIEPIYEDVIETEKKWFQKIDWKYLSAYIIFYIISILLYILFIGWVDTFWQSFYITMLCSYASLHLAEKFKNKK